MRRYAAWILAVGCGVSGVGCVGFNAAAEVPFDDPGGHGGPVDGGLLPPRSPLDGGVPCGVLQVLADRCWSCHSAPPSSGAVMPLVSYADLVSPAHTQPTKS